MNVRITVTLLKGKAAISTFTFICSEEQEIGSGVDAAIAFFRRRSPEISLFDTSMLIRFGKD